MENTTEHMQIAPRSALIVIAFEEEAPLSEAREKERGRIARILNSLVAFGCRLHQWRYEYPFDKTFLISNVPHPRFHPCLRRDRFSQETFVTEPGPSGFTAKYRNSEDYEKRELRITLDSELRRYHICRIAIMGLRGNGTLLATAQDARRLGFETFVVSEGLEKDNPHAFGGRLAELEVADIPIVSVEEIFESWCHERDEMID